MKMKSWLLGLGAALLFGAAAFAQGFAPAAQIVSPANTPGQFPYIAGPQSTAVNANGGTFTCAAGAATVANTKVTANSVILLTLKTAGGTVAAPFIATITAGTGFTVTCGGSDTSTYNYLILG
jgi:hypothetical protein